MPPKRSVNPPSSSTSSSSSFSSSSSSSTSLWNRSTSSSSSSSSWNRSSSSSSSTMMKVIVCFMCASLGKDVKSEMLGSSFDDRRSGPLEICQWSGLNASCPIGSVIMVEHALYGRMRLSKCIDKNYGYIGCSVDMKEYLEYRCAGRGQCHVTLPDEYLDKQIRPCPSDLKSYLEISYYCLTVQHKADEKSCSSPIELKLTSGDPTSGLLSNHVTGETNQGSAKCPWVLRGQPGVKFKFTLFDFAMVDGGPAKSGVCSIYAQIKETFPVPSSSSSSSSSSSPSSSSSSSSSSLHQPNTMICGGENRHHVVYTSESHVVRVELTNPMTSSRASYFLLKYETFDCPEVTIPPGAVLLEKKADRITLYCKVDGLKTPSTWEMRCEGNKWVGREANCSISDGGLGSWRFAGNLFGGQSSLTRNVVGGFIALTAVMVAIAILLIGVWSITRSRRKSRETRRQQELREKVLSGSSGTILDALMHDHVNNHHQQQQQQQQLGDYTGVNSMLSDKSYRYAKDKDDGVRPIVTSAEASSAVGKFPARGFPAKLQPYPESYPIPPPPVSRQYRVQHFPSSAGQTGLMMDMQPSVTVKDDPVRGQDICYDDACGRLALHDPSQNFSRQYMDFQQQQSLSSQNFIPKQQQQQPQLYEDHIYESPKFLRKVVTEKSEVNVP